jgi:hypothetical protein
MRTADRAVPRRPSSRRDPSIIVGLIIALGLLGASGTPMVLAQASPEAVAPEAWARADVPATPAGLDLWDVIAGGPGFIAVGGGFPEGSETATALIWVSQDGRSWLSVPLFGEAARGLARAIVATGDGYVVVGSGCCPDEAAVWLSGDGISWERLPDQPGFGSTAMLGIASTPTGLVAVGCAAVMECGGGLSWTSPDGRSWSEPVTMPILPFDLVSAGTGVLATGTTEAYGGGAASSLSEDGSTWLAPVEVGAPGSLETAAELEDGFLAAGGWFDMDSGASGPLLLRSADAGAWEPVPARRLGDAWLDDVLVRDDGVLLVGWRSARGTQVPASYWTSDLVRFGRGAFPRELKPTGMIHAAAALPGGSVTVAVGQTTLNRGSVPTVWVSVAPAG